MAALRVESSADGVAAWAAARLPAAPLMVARAQEMVPWSKRQIEPWQAAALAVLADRYSRKGSRFLEIGTAYGFSAAVLALAAPGAEVLTLNPKTIEVPLAMERLKPLGNVRVLEMASAAFYSSPTSRVNYHLVFVDGGHTDELVRLDFYWLNRVKIGGLLLFHDYTPVGPHRACPPVYDAVNELLAALGRGPDVLIVGDGEGMAGVIRREEDKWPI